MLKISFKVVTNSINRGTETRRKLGETYTVGSSRYKNLKLKKREKKKIISIALEV
jgi:hypothetical protein